MPGKCGVKRKRADEYVDSRTMTASFIRPGQRLRKIGKDFMFAVKIFCLVQEREGLTLGSSAVSLQQSSTGLF